MPDIVPVILAGGHGKRLRPLTSRHRPKPLLRLFSKYSLLQQTLNRVTGFTPAIIIGADQYAADFLTEAYNINAAIRTIICEPVARSTAAAVIMAALALEHEDPNTVMAVMPSDHMIKNKRIFHDTLIQAAHIAQNERCFVLLGAKAMHSSTRYGYIWTKSGNKIFRFIEKPSKKQAIDIFKCEGRVFWNTGIFCVRVSDFISAAKTYAPKMLQSCRFAYENSIRKDKKVIFNPLLFIQIRARAIDYVIMEHLKEAYCLPLQTRWADIGTWTALYKHLEEEISGKASR